MGRLDVFQIYALTVQVGAISVGTAATLDAGVFFRLGGPNSIVSGVGRIASSKATSAMAVVMATAANAWIICGSPHGRTQGRTTMFIKSRGTRDYPDEYLDGQLGLIRLDQQTANLPWAKA